MRAWPLQINFSSSLRALARNALRCVVMVRQNYVPYCGGPMGQMDRQVIRLSHWLGRGH